MITRTLAVLALLGAVPAHATLHGFDAPGGGDEDGKGTYVNGINIEGDVTGNVISPGGQSSGFVRGADGTITVFTAATGADTHAIDIRGLTAVGYYLGDDARNHGFFRTLDGTVTTFDLSSTLGS